MTARDAARSDNPDVVLSGADIVLPDRVVERGSLFIDKGRIAAIESRPVAASWSARILPRVPNAPPGHILRGCSTYLSLRSATPTWRTVSSSGAVASPSGRVPVHTEHRPHASAYSSSSACASSSIRQRREPM